MLHDILGDKQNEGKAVVFWSKCDPRSRANAAALLACYMVRRPQKRNEKKKKKPPYLHPRRS